MTRFSGLRRVIWASVISATLIFAHSHALSQNQPSKHEQPPQSAKEHSTATPDKEHSQPARITPNLSPPNDPINVVAQDEKQSAVVYKWECDNPQNQEQAEICQQRRIAESAERSADYALWQLAANGIGLLFIVASLIFTAIAARAASRAAKAAYDSIEVASKNAERELRAYLSIRISNFKFLRGANNAVQCEAAYTIVNDGKTPAYSVRVDSDFRFAPTPLVTDFAAPGKNRLDYQAALNPHQGYTGSILKGQSLDSFTQGDKLYLIGVVRYRDAFQHDRETWFCGYVEQTDAIVATGGALGQANVSYKLAERHNNAT